MLKHQQAFRLVGVWRPLREADAALLAVSAATAPMQHRIEPHPQSKLPVLRVRTDAVPIAPPEPAARKP